MGKSYSLISYVRATDTNNDVIKYGVGDSPPEGLLVNPTTGAISWSNVPDDTSGALEVTASDGTAKSVLPVTVKLCKCAVGRLYVCKMLLTLN